jgi:GAF domain-containing protein
MFKKKLKLDGLNESRNVFMTEEFSQKEIDRRNLAAQRSSQVILAVAAVSLILALIHAFQHPGGPAFMLAGAVILLGATSGFAWRFSLLGQRMMALVSLVIGIVVVSIVASVFYSGISLLVTLMQLGVIALIAWRTMDSRRVILVMITLMIVSAGIIIADQLLLGRRPSLLPAWLVNTGLGAMGVVLLVVMAMRFPSYPLRSKLLFSFMIMAVGAVVAVSLISINNTRNALISSANQSLSTASIQTATVVDAFIYNVLEMLETQAQNPALYLYLSAEADQRSYDLFREANNLLGSYVSRNALGTLTAQRQAFLESYMLVDRDGIVLIDSRRTRVGEVLVEEEYIYQPLSAGKTYISPVIFEKTGQPMLYFSTRVPDILGQPVGVLVVIYNAQVLQTVIEGSNNLIGEGSYALLLDENNLRLAQGVPPASMYRLIAPFSQDQFSGLRDNRRIPNVPASEMASDLPGLGEVLSSASVPINFSFSIDADIETRMLGVVALMESRPWKVIYTQSEDLFLAPVELQIRNIQLMAILVTTAAGVLGIILAQVLIRPIARLTDVSKLVTAGDLSVRASITTKDEVGTLAAAFNTMTGQLEQVLSGLEKRVQDRTRDLERRSTQLEASAEIGSTAATIREINELLPKMTHLISEKFGFYHVGIFLVDESAKYAVLQAANSEGGLRMLARGHRLEIGQQGLVGYVASTGTPRIALDVGDDAVFFNNPDLPDTRSELALPLLSGRQLIGALDVQSTQPSAFTREDISILQVMANLISVAIENARLFEESQSALEATRRAYGEMSKQAWMKMLGSQPVLGFRSRDTGIVSLDTEREGVIEQDQKAEQSLSIPIKVRDHVIGYLDTYKPEEQGGWTSDEYEAIYAIVDQVGVALESARLYESSVIQAERERMVSQVSTALRESLDVEAVMETAVRELQRALEIAEVEVRLIDPSQISLQTPDQDTIPER